MGPIQVHTPGYQLFEIQIGSNPSKVPALKIRKTKTNQLKVCTTQQLLTGLDRAQQTTKSEIEFKFISNCLIKL